MPPNTVFPVWGYLALEQSDIDVYVEGNLHGFFALSGIKADLEELLGCPVDIVRLRERMDTFFKDRILSEGIYV